MFLITGATGFVGGHMVDLMLNHKLPIRALVRSEKKGALLAARGVEIVVGDLTNKVSLQQAVQGVTGIFHIGATFREPHLSNDDYFKINTEATENLISLAEDASVKRFIYCSTNGVVGSSKELPSRELTPMNPGDVYQESKAEGEKRVLRFLEHSKMTGAVIRPGMIYGFGDTRFLKIFQMVKKRTFFYVGTGDALVHFLDVRDLVEGFFLAMHKHEINRQVFLLGGDTVCTLREVIQFVAEKLNVRPPWLQLPVGPMQLAGDLCEILCKPLGISPPLYRRRIDFFTKHRCFNTSHARKELGWRPRKHFFDELTEILEWYRSNGLL